MSPDDIFAAQFWPWPDPAIKRDNQGRVLFVNAAFLQLYGGTVQDWTGNVVGGWPAPQGPGQPYRFETRMPMTADMGEQVYDWMEMTLADGHAFALARNVTFFMQPADPQPNEHMPVQGMAVQASDVQNYAAEAAPTDMPAPALEEPMYDAPAFEAPTFDTPVEDVQNVTPLEVMVEQPAPDVPHEPVVFAEYTPEPEVINQAPDTPQVDAPLAAPMQDQPVAAAPSEMPTNLPPVQAPVTEASNASNPANRAYERRALPIENESAVLGNNWRDAVIARAVGADAVPATAAETPDPMASTIATDNAGPKRILLAEDNAINALLTRTLLEAEGHTVETVQDGQLAVEAMKTSTYDLVFMDMRMPNMDGLEATRKIRTLQNVRKNLPIIALTANAFDDDRNACFDSGMNDFMTKPVSAEELSEMVAQWTAPKEDRMAS